MKAIRRASISEEIFNRLKNEIVRHTWEPGDKIPSENELAKAYGVSRIALREALKKLITLGLLESRQGEGTFIKQPEPSMHMDSLIPVFVLGNRDVVLVLEFRRVIEVETAGLAADRATSGDIARLERIYRNMEKHKEDYKKFAFLDMAFHIALAEITRNPLIVRVINIIRDVLSENFVDICRIRGNMEGLCYHRKILDAVKAGDREKAKDCMEEHIVRAIKELSENNPDSNEIKETKTDRNGI